MSDALQNALELVALGLELAGNGKPIGVIASVVRHTVGQRSEDATKRILVGQGALAEDVDKLFALYKEEYHA